MLKYLYISSALFAFSYDITKTEVTIKYVRSEIMQCVIDFAYSYACTIDEENIIELIVTAEYFCFPQLVNRCCRFIVDNLRPTNCISMMLTSRF